MFVFKMKTFVHFKTKLITTSLVSYHVMVFLKPSVKFNV